MSTFGSRLKVFRELKGLSQIDFAKEIGVNQVNITYWETDKNLPNSAKTMLLQKAFPELNSDWLFTGKGEMLNKEKPVDKSLDKWDQRYYELLEKYTKLLEKVNKL